MKDYVKYNNSVPTSRASSVVSVDRKSSINSDFFKSQSSSLTADDIAGPDNGI